MRREWKDGRSVQQRNSRNPEVILLLIFFELLNHLRGQAQLGVGASGRTRRQSGAVSAQDSYRLDLGYDNDDPSFTAPRNKSRRRAQQQPRDREGV